MVRWIRVWLLVLVLGGAALPAAAEPPRLGLPVACAPGEDCWVVNYVDRDPSDKARDYACGTATYDGHKGVDFALRDMEAMRGDGVPVLAAAPGVVAGTRDGMDDVDFRAAGGRESVKGRECGNGVAVHHGDGWVTQYCHMRQHSVTVEKGDRVKAGQRLGLAGHSGLAMFPHLHLGVRRGKAVVDPFTGPGDPAGCGVTEDTLWHKEALAALTYRPTALYTGGFSASRPSYEGVHEGLYRDDVLPRRSPALILWAEMFHVRPGDRVSMRITGPDGERVLDYRNTLDEKKARRMVYAGKPRPGLRWPKGRYRGEVILRRDPQGDDRPMQVWRLEREVTLR